MQMDTPKTALDQDSPQFEAMAREAGFRLARHWSDERDWFSVCFLEVDDAEA